MIVFLFYSEDIAYGQNVACNVMAKNVMAKK